jgi:hypothetical protein
VEVTRAGSVLPTCRVARMTRRRVGSSLLRSKQCFQTRSPLPPSFPPSLPPSLIACLPSSRSRSAALPSCSVIWPPPSSTPSCSLPIRTTIRTKTSTTLAMGWSPCPRKLTKHCSHVPQFLSVEAHEIPEDLASKPPWDSLAPGTRVFRLTVLPEEQMTHVQVRF